MSSVMTCVSCDCVSLSSMVLLLTLLYSMAVLTVLYLTRLTSPQPHLIYFEVLVVTPEMERSLEPPSFGLCSWKWTAAQRCFKSPSSVREREYVLCACVRARVWSLVLCRVCM